MYETTEKPNVDELYSTASNTSDLTVEADRRGAGDVLIAAGWSPTRLGGALMRLQSEYDAAQTRGAGKTDAQLLRSSLRSLSTVNEQMALKAALWGIEDGRARAEAVVLWWLDRKCRRCTGRLFERIPGSPALSSVRCRQCAGLGEVRIPHGQDGRKLASFIDDCVGRARHHIRDRLRAHGR